MGDVLGYDVGVAGDCRHYSMLKDLDYSISSTGLPCR